jgi:hypothetical protein
LCGFWYESATCDDLLRELSGDNGDLLKRADCVVITGSYKGDVLDSFNESLSFTNTSILKLRRLHSSFLVLIGLTNMIPSLACFLQTRSSFVLTNIFYDVTVLSPSLSRYNCLSPLAFGRSDPIPWILFDPRFNPPLLWVRREELSDCI